MRAVVSSFLGLSLLCSSAWAVETAPAPAVASLRKQRLQYLHHKPFQPTNQESYLKLCRRILMPFLQKTKR